MQSRVGGRVVKPEAKGAMRVNADAQPLWQFDFAEVTGHNLESRGRKEVNRLLAAGWRLLHIYTLRYEQDGVWRKRPMAILGRLRNNSGVERTTESPDHPQKSPQETPVMFPMRNKSLGGAAHARQ